MLSSQIIILFHHFSQAGRRKPRESFPPDDDDEEDTAKMSMNCFSGNIKTLEVSIKVLQAMNRKTIAIFFRFSLYPCKNQKISMMLECTQYKNCVKKLKH